jgi:hypothetical protein
VLWARALLLLLLLLLVVLMFLSFGRPISRQTPAWSSLRCTVVLASDGRRHDTLCPPLRQCPVSARPLRVISRCELGLTRQRSKESG